MKNIISAVKTKIAVKIQFNTKGSSRVKMTHSAGFLETTVSVHMSFAAVLCTGASSIEAPAAHLFLAY